jgi:hypothetical protein
MTAAAGSVSLTKSYLRTQLADCATFRTLCGAANQAAALAHIYLDSLGDPPGGAKEFTQAAYIALRPFAIISLVDRTATPQGVNGDGSISFSRSYEHEIRLERNVTAELAANPAECDLTWDNIWGSIMDEIEALSGKAGYLACSVRRADGPWRIHPSDVQDFGDCQKVTLATTTVD